MVVYTCDAVPAEEENTEFSLLVANIFPGTEKCVKLSRNPL